tara:strand:+ start:3303 stop:4643 length:1341 start_codon:yes stop_codon:yes gene_type:complete
MIKNYKLEDVKEEICKKENKELYGEVFTPFSFTSKILDVIPEDTFKNPNLTWLDPGAGTGNFSIILYFKLLKNLEIEIQDIEERKNHIIKNMIYMVEIQYENCLKLKNLFGEESNIYEGDFLNYSTQTKNKIPNKFDVIVGNPPFNTNGVKKVPTNNELDKKNDGKTLWFSFVSKSVELLKNNSGMLCMFIPSIWLKPDREKIYYFLTQFNIKNLNCFSNSDTNKIFKGNAQTPSCYFLLTKSKSDKIINIYDRYIDKYVDYYLKKDIPIPVCNIKIVNTLQKYCKNNNYIKVIKTNLPPKKTIISNFESKETPFPNITTTLLSKDGYMKPKIVINYSNVPLYGFNKEKLVLANKMYGLPYLDSSGIYGISNRDNYIIYKDNVNDLDKLSKFLSTRLVLKVFDATRYRMKYLEKYAFELIPDITNIEDFPEEINDDTVNNYFNINV